MNELTFWQIIEDAHKQSGGNCSLQVDSIEKDLTKLDDLAIVEFKKILLQRLNQSCSWDLLNSMAIIEGYVSDDSFEYWRAGLILQGRKIFEDALKNPETLADVRFERCERFLYSATEVWCNRHPDEDMIYPSVPKAELSGDNPISTVEELKARFPRLVEMFWDKWTQYSPYRERVQEK